MGTESHRVYVWDAATGAILQTLEGHQDAIRAVAITPDGRQYLTASQDHSAKLWDAATGKEVATLSGHNAPVLAIACSTDSKRAVTGAFDKSVIIWDLKKRTVEKKLPINCDDIEALAFSPDSRQVMVGLRQLPKSFDVFGQPEPVEGGDSKNPFKTRPLLVQDVGGAWESKSYAFGAALQIGPLTYSPDGARAVAAAMIYEPKRLYFETIIFDSQTGKVIHELPAGGGEVGAVAWSADGQMILTGNTGPDVLTRLWDAASGKLLASFMTNTEGITSLGFMPAGRSFWAASRDGTIRVWDLPASVLPMTPR